MVQVKQLQFESSRPDIAASSSQDRLAGHDVFADIFGQSFELQTFDRKDFTRKPDLSANTEVSPNEPVPESRDSVRDDTVNQNQTDERDISGKTESTQIDDEATVRVEKNDQAKEPTENKLDEGDVSKEEQEVSEEAIPAQPVNLLQRLAAETNAQNTQNQVVAAQAAPLKLSAEQQGLTSVKENVLNIPLQETPEESAKNQNPSNTNPAKLDVVIPPSENLPKPSVLENSVKIVAKEVGTDEVLTPLESRQGEGEFVIESQAKNIETFSENSGQSLGPDARGDGQSQSQTRSESLNVQLAQEAKVPEPLQPPPAIEIGGKKTTSPQSESSLISSTHEVSAGKLETVKGPQASQAPVESELQITREKVEQVVKAVRLTVARGASRIQLRLDPPELGHLRIEIKQSSSGMQLQLQATTLKAQQLLERGAGQLRAALDSHGFQAAQIEVQLRTDLQNDRAGDQPLPDHFNHNQSPGQGQSSSDDFDTLFQNEALASNASDPTDELEDEPVLSGESSANRWQETKFTGLDVLV